MTANNDPISQSLGLNPLVVQTNTINSMITDAHNDSAVKDFEKSRANILSTMDILNDAIPKLAELSYSSQLPRSFEVLAKLVDSQVAASKSLLDIQEKIKNLNEINDSINPKGKVVNNNLFIGSTAELSAMLKKLKEE